MITIRAILRDLIAMDRKTVRVLGVRSGRLHRREHLIAHLAVAGQTYEIEAGIDPTLDTVPAVLRCGRMISRTQIDTITIGPLTEANWADLKTAFQAASNNIRMLAHA